MKDFNDIQSTWNQHFFSPKTELNTMINLAKSFERNRYWFLLIQLAVLLIIFPLFVFRFFSHLSLSIEQWGYSRIILSILFQLFIAFLIFFKFRQLFSIRKLLEILSPVDYLEALKKYQHELIFWYGKVFPAFIITWFAIGMIANYVPGYEHSFRNWLTMVVIVILIWGSVLLIMQLVLRNRLKFRNQIITELERLQKQLTDE
jgi:hypothetical protein